MLKKIALTKEIQILWKRWKRRIKSAIPLKTMQVTQKNLLELAKWNIVPLMREARLRQMTMEDQTRRSQNMMGKVRTKRARACLRNKRAAKKLRTWR